MIINSLEEFIIFNVLNFISTLCLSGITYIDGNIFQQVTVTADKPGMYDMVTGADFLYKLK